MERFRRNIIAGLLAIIPILVTWWVVWTVLDLLVRTGRPFIRGAARGVRPYSPEVADLILAPAFQSALALLIVVAALYLLGALTNAVLGRRVLHLVHRIMESVPFVKTVYGAVRTLIDSLQAPTKGRERVVLIEFPNSEMRAVGFVTSTFRAADTGQEVAAVYVPTTPNPTSGYVEIVPTERLVWLDWTANEAMSFIVSGGAMAPEAIRFHPDPLAKPPEPKPKRETKRDKRREPALPAAKGVPPGD
jgi:uncharacterized membrane protein